MEPRLKNGCACGRVYVTNRHMIQVLHGLKCYNNIGLQNNIVRRLPLPLESNYNNIRNSLFLL